MMQIHTESRQFSANKAASQAEAVQRVALQLVCGLDLDALLTANREDRQGAVLKLQRLIHRERLKGLSLHWSYDLDRHIALKQAYERLCATLGVAAEILHGAGRSGYGRKTRAWRRPSEVSDAKRTLLPTAHLAEPDLNRS